ncbi:uncharacterized protein B0H18DRAFT_870886 [Fomitopsis serialis]|uniref:uncharacterized protein n=1 Tax=Fomitopsis serialis TaxID=139415 RepID=UPI002008CDBC|nr:uncharacterized protein B0H18DRAFT_870886 [Neoantrodia serialis]KAH9932990.1 hypothetical protein B0H18DRAFT_870886 [Neoantrodia serialis]
MSLHRASQLSTFAETNGSTSRDEDLSPSESWREDASELFTAAQLPSGRYIPNRLVKVAMYEHMSALFGGPPNDAHLKLYARWAEGGWGMVCTGNVQVCEDHLSLGRDVVVPARLTPETIEPFTCLARAIHYGSAEGAEGNGEKRTVAVLQLSHPGRQSTNIIGGRWPFAPPVAPSAVPVGRRTADGEGSASALLSRLVHTVFFQTPRPMSLSDISDVVESFVRGAELAVASGFDGVQLHAAHGYLISQFMSPKTNRRIDEYGAPENALRFLHDIVSAIRDNDKIPDEFILGIKLNAADYVDHGGSDRAPPVDSNHNEENQALEHVRQIAEWEMLDFMEVSGGDYEDPAFMTKTTSPRQAYFTEFAHEVKQMIASQFPKPPLILLTGGLRTLPLMSSVLKHGHADLLGIGRLSVLCPDLPRTLEAAMTGDLTTDRFPMEPLPEPDLESPVVAPSRRSSLQHARALFFHIQAYMLARSWALLPVRLPPLVGAGTAMAWYMVTMRRVAAQEPVDYSVGGVEAVLRMWLWLAPDSRGCRGLVDGVLESWWGMGVVGVLLGFVLGIGLPI